MLFRRGHFTPQIFPKDPHRRNEINIVERVRDHYVDEDLSHAAHKEVDSGASAAPSDPTLLDSTLSEHTISPIGSLHLDTTYSKITPDADARPTKRQKSDSTEASTWTTNDEFAPSSERSSPSEHEPDTFQALPNQGAVHIYEETNKEGFKLIGSFITVKRAAEFSGVRSKEITKVKNSGTIFREIQILHSTHTKDEGMRSWESEIV